MEPNSAGKLHMTCTDKFGTAVPMPATTLACDFVNFNGTKLSKSNANCIAKYFESGNTSGAFETVKNKIPLYSFDELR